MCHELLLPGERIDDLQLQNLRIIQHPQDFCFGMDAVLLADFAASRVFHKVCDFGTGTGILPLLLYGRNPSAAFDAVEIQEKMAERATRSVLLNSLADKITVHARDLKDVRQFLPHAAYDLVVCNPPYSESGAGLSSPIDSRRLSREEAACTLDDIAKAAQFVLKWHGRLAIMLPVARMADAFEALRRHQIEPKRMRLVHANAARDARLMLLEGVRGAKCALTVMPPLLAKDEKGNDSEEVRRIYHLV